MFDPSPPKLSSNNFYSIFQKNKKVKLSKQGINLISNGNLPNNPQNKNVQAETVKILGKGPDSEKINLIEDIDGLKIIKLDFDKVSFNDFLCFVVVIHISVTDKNNDVFLSC